MESGRPHIGRIRSSASPKRGEMTRCDSNSHARDVGGEEVNAVAVEVAAGAVEDRKGCGVTYNLMSRSL